MKRIFLLSFFVFNFCCAMDNSSYANGFVQGNQPFFCQPIYYPGPVFFNGQPPILGNNPIDYLQSENQKLKDRVNLLKGINSTDKNKIKKMEKGLSEKKEEIGLLQKMVLEYKKKLKTAEKSLRSKFDIENYACYLKMQNSFIHKEFIKVEEENERVRNKYKAMELLPNFGLKSLLLQKDEQIKKLKNENKVHKKEYRELEKLYKEMYYPADYSGFKVSINAAKSLLKDEGEIGKVKTNDNEVREPFFKL